MRGSEDPMVQQLIGALPGTLCERWLAACSTPGEASRPLPALTDLAATEVLQAVAASALRAPIEQALGPAPLCNLSQSWLRHGRPPHRWHQDGALGFDFLAHAETGLPTDAMLKMLTCWITLTACGDHAPGLEWVDAEMDGLLLPHQLADTAVATRFAPTQFVRPSLAAGDALLFSGELLHRTHVEPSMTEARCSLELRFFRAGTPPTRLAGDQFAVWA